MNPIDAQRLPGRARRVAHVLGPYRVEDGRIIGPGPTAKELAAMPQDAPSLNALADLLNLSYCLGWLTRDYNEPLKGDR